MGERTFLIVLCGLPFSGKSTLGRAIREQLGYQVIEVDAYHGEFDFAERAPTDREWIGAFGRAYRQLDRILASGKNAVFDAASYARKDRDRLYRMAVTHRAEPVVIFIDVSLAEALARVEENRKNPVRVNVPEDEIRVIAAKIERPGADERPLIYRTEESLAVWIEQNLIERLSDRT